MSARAGESAAAFSISEIASSYSFERREANAFVSVAYAGSSGAGVS
jgi:hypothetical protein